jgi:hypothetical protein
MLTSSVSRASERRGIVLVLVLAMLGLLALVGITFATYAGQSKINNRIFMQSLFQPQADELIDFGLAQLITDTNDIRSAIRGHSLARDMYGDDATGNALLGASPSSGLSFQITAATPSTLVPNQYILTTNINSSDPAFFGYNFKRWIMRVHYTAVPTIGIGNGVIDQTFEVLQDDTSNTSRQLTVFINLIDAGASTMDQSPSSGAEAADPYLPAGMGTALHNRTTGATTQLPGLYISTAANPANNTSLVNTNTFTLDGRWLHAFNGAGVGQKLTVTGLPASYYGNYRFTGPNVTQPGLDPVTGGALIPGAPGMPGMDEDYDACDLENWFMAIQSADGQVIVPSFHRPGIIRIDANNNVNDWDRQNQSNPNGGTLWADSAARILRPCRADGHDAQAFKDLKPDPATGKITYDVDNDGDGTPDSVWVDLGYPARRDASGRLYKPLFAFMVIGLNGRIPLNTAGNLADLTEVAGLNVPASPATPPTYYSGPTHASHLGNSVSEVDPTYALQNAFDPLTGDPLAAFAPPPLLNVGGGPGGVFYPPGTGTQTFATNSQVDNAGIDVRLTQLRNLLAGTRPPAVNQDFNYVGSSSGTGVPPAIPVANGMAEPPGILGLYDGTAIDANGFPYVIRTTTPVPGRWGEAQSIPGNSFPNPSPAAAAGSAPQYVNVVGGNYSNPVRAGYSLNIYDIINGLPPDAGDDNYNTYDPFPLRQVTLTGNTVATFGGEYGDRDFYDAAGALLFPAERMRRWINPADINGTGAATTWNQGRRAANHGADAVGRVEFSSYFRPPGSPGAIATNYSVDTTTGVVTPADAAVAMGSVLFPDYANFYTDVYNPAGITATAGGAQYAYLPDMTSNPLHGLEQARFPNQAYANFTPQRSGGSPAGVTNPAGGAYQNVDANDIPIAFPTYDYYINANFQSDGLNDADEMNLYSPNPLNDSPYGPGDIEWLYRKQDVDGASLSSRLSQLAPVSFTNGLDGARRRKLFALDSWDMNSFSWTNDNPIQTTFVTDPVTGNINQVLLPAFPTNSLFGLGVDGGFRSAGLSTPALAHRGKKINLNYPLPVSNDPNEPVRQKWISDAYQLLRSILPPKAVDTPEELAQLSQYVINIVDFRDTDGTMTHWINPDVVIAGVPVSTTGLGTVAVTNLPPVSLCYKGQNPQPPQPPLGSPIPANPMTQTIPLDQYGMEQNPVALNEVLAYSYVNNPTGTGTPTRVNRFFVELVNTSTSPELSTSVYNAPGLTTNPGTGFSPVLDLGGYVFTPPAGGPGTGASDPYSGGSWDIIFTADDPYSRPDPYRGQLVPYGNIYAATPLNQYSFSPQTTTAPTGAPTPVPNQPVNPTTPPAGTPTDGYNVMLQPLDSAGGIPAATPAYYPITSASNTSLSGVTYPFPTNYFYVIGNTPPGTTMETGSPTPGASIPPGPATNPNGPGQNPAGLTTYIVPSNTSQIVAPPPATAAAIPVGTYFPASMVQSFKTTVPTGQAGGMDPVTGATATTSPIPLYQGALCPTTAQLPGLMLTTSTTSPNPSTTTQLPANYATKLPAMPIAVGTGTYPLPGSYYWVCLRRPANLFAPVSITNPMIVVDATRFPYTDGTAMLAAGPNPPGPTIAGATVSVPQVPLGAGTSVAGAPAPFSVQRYQPYRGGHAVPVSVPVNLTPQTSPAGSITPIDTRYGYTEQIVVPSIDSQTMMSTRGIYTQSGGTNYYATQNIYHTLGWANEYEQGSGNSVAEPWDYFPFNDRDFTSVAELLLVPGCAPGLFTKQFVEFPPSLGNVTNIFNAVIANEGPPPYVAIGGGAGASIYGAVAQPTATPPLTTWPPTIPVPPANPQPAAGMPEATTPATVSYVQAYTTASTPFSYTDASTTSPQPRSYPYLNDEFFYTGYGGATTFDAGGLVGGYAGDGWFKMFEFFEVPSQSNGAIGPVASGTNFDWYRNDIKPGQLNMNLIMDEEVFFSIAGDQTITQSNGQNMDAMGGPLNPKDQFSQQLLNFTQIKPLPANVYYTLATSTPAAPNFMLTAPAVGQLMPGGTPGYSPVPLMVTSSLADGTPATAVPISQSTTTAGMTAVDPVNYSFFITNSTGTPATYGPAFYGNGLKTAWVQFLNLRHGGSGFVFGFGNGAVGQNSAVGVVGPNMINTPSTPPQILPPNVANSFYGTGVPADRPFRSLSYPDINYTVMRPAALPPNPYTNPVVNPVATVFGAPNVYFASDPGVRNFTQYLGYPTAVGAVEPTYPGTLPATTPAGIPTFTAPWVTAAGGPVLYGQVHPPAIPVRRLFQVPDNYRGAGTTGWMLTTMATAPSAAPATPPAGALVFTGGASNASSAGDPYLNNTIPGTPTGPGVPAAGYYPVTNLPFASPGAVAPVAYPITPTVPLIANPSGNNVDLYWPGSSPTRMHDGVVGDAAVTITGASLPPGYNNPNLGTTNTDNRQHPYWRSEQIQRIMNLTTPRTHQYAVWLTVGFFEVIRQGDLGMFVYNPLAAFDILGPEIGAANGKSTRYRGFYLVDRLKLTGYNPSSPGGFRQAIVYRQRIQ